VCGIVGILARGSRVSADVLRRATLSLSHRGPDDFGTTIIRQTEPEALEVGLGNTRLAILDLSPNGHQPTHDPATGNWIVYNGELYNFREIREELQREGTQFSSQSDTEVVLKAFGRWGEEALEQFRGMFALAIWDSERHRLFLARDPLGIKPLYYCALDRQFLFASELRTLLSTNLVARRLDQAGVFNYLTFGSAYDPNTLIEGVRSLRAGHYLVWQDGAFHEQMYWDPIDGDEQRGSAQDSAAEREALAEKLRAELCDAVGSQLISDVPVSVFLSGGIDSSSLVSILSSSGVRPSTFSVTFQERAFNEAECSRNIAHRFGTDHHEMVVSQQDALDAVPSALQAMDQPTIDGVNTYLVARQTRAAGVKVALSGLGGDEIFGGYSSFRTVPRMERFAHFWKRWPEPIRHSVGNAFSVLSPSNDQNRKLAALASENGRLIHPYFLSRMLFTPRMRDLMFASADEQAIERANAPLREVLSRSQPLDPFNRVSYLETRCYMLNTLLRDADCMSMAHGLETRVPLLDQHLVKTIMSLPGSWKMNGGLPKPLLVGSLPDPLPNEIVNRPKRGFTLPFELWLRDQMRPAVENAVHRISEGPLGALLNANRAWRVWEDFLCGRTSWSRPWSLYVLQRWCELHL
jgi:asparagine synthase (glutamine-hydrolysing)